MGSSQSRFVLVSRRALLKGLGVAATAGAVGACSGGDSQVFVSSSDVVAGTDVQPSPEASAGTSGNATGAANGAPLPASAKLTVAFTFAVGGDQGGPARNPYVAVWIEDDGEEMVSTLAVWHLQQDERWLHELKRWYQVSGGYEVNTGPTRVAGDYSLVWDGTGREGGKVPSGQYFVCIEAAREHGPYELIRQPVTLGASAVTKDLEPNQELTKASVSYTV